jgi:hypothetical protein
LMRSWQQAWYRLKDQVSPHTLPLMTYNSNGRFRLNTRREGNRQTNCEPRDRAMGIGQREPVCTQDNYPNPTFKRLSIIRDKALRVRRERTSLKIPQMFGQY